MEPFRGLVTLLRGPLDVFLVSELIPLAAELAGFHCFCAALGFLCWEGLGGWAPRGAPGFPLPLGRGQRGTGPRGRD